MKTLLVLRTWIRPFVGRRMGDVGDPKREKLMRDGPPETAAHLFLGLGWAGGRFRDRAGNGAWGGSGRGRDRGGAQLGNGLGEVREQVLDL